MSEPIIGIDLGTTNSAVAALQRGLPRLLQINGERLLPSVVGISSDGAVLVGTPARNQWVAAPERTVRSIKRKMGSGETVTMAGKTYSPQEISAFILKKIKRSAEAALGSPVNRAVITVPAYFNEVQRQATIEAGDIAGLAVERIINEPTAAALAYGYGQDGDEHLRILVYDLGGGTFDVSIIELGYGVVDVLATAGDNYLGGDDFDERLAARLADEFEEEHGIDLQKDHRAWVRLLRAAEEAKIELSSLAYTTIALEYIAEDAGGTPLHIRREVSRQEFQDLIIDLLEVTAASIDSALEEAELQTDDIDRVLLVGGSTRIPAVQELVRTYLDQEPQGQIDPDAVVALGAAVQAGIVAGEEIDAILVDVTPFSLGLEVAEFNMTGQLKTDRFATLIRRNTTIPVEKSETFSTLYPEQEAIHVKVYQGEHKTASKNVLLGDFMIENLRPNLPDGRTEVTVDFRLDVNGILDVTVAERGSKNAVTEQLKASRQRLSPDEIARSRKKLEATGGNGAAGPDIDVDAATNALMERAQQVLERPDLEGDVAADLAGLIADIQRSAAEGDEGRVEQYSDELADLLMDLEV